MQSWPQGRDVYLIWGKAQVKDTEVSGKQQCHISFCLNSSQRAGPTNFNSASNIPSFKYYSVTSLSAWPLLLFLSLSPMKGLFKGHKLGGGTKQDLVRPTREKGNQVEDSSRGDEG